MCCCVRLRAILIKTATIGYGRTPDFEVQPSNAPTSAQQIAYALLTPVNPLRIACQQEGLDANKAAALLLRPPVADNRRRATERAKIGAEWKKLLEGDSPANVTVVNARRPSSGVRDPSGDGTYQRVEETEKQAQGQVKSGSGVCTGGPGAKIKEVKGDKRKPGKARMAYSKFEEQVKERMEEGRRDSDGEFGPKARVALVPQEGQTKAGWQERAKKGHDNADNGKKRGQDIARAKEGTARGLEDANHRPGKHDAKL